MPGFFQMVRSEGLEPPTYKFVACCSIQLSYDRIHPHKRPTQIRARQPIPSRPQITATRRRPHDAAGRVRAQDARSTHEVGGRTRRPHDVAGRISAHEARSHHRVGEIRRERDSNPRYDFTSYNGLANRRLQPLGHLSPSGSEHYTTRRGWSPSDFCRSGALGAGCLGARHRRFLHEDRLRRRLHCDRFALEMSEQCVDPEHPAGRKYDADRREYAARPNRAPTTRSGARGRL